MCEAEDFSVLTYATHKEGSFAELFESVPGIVVGGWGEAWHGFMQKFEFVLAYARKKHPRHVVIFVDGFDTEARLEPAEAARRFRALDVPFLVSSLGMEMHLPDLLARRLFMCRSEACANTGLYMGYAEAVCLVLEAALAIDNALEDDQRAFEIARGRVPEGTIFVDTDCEIFHNLNAKEARLSPDSLRAVFLGRNGRGMLQSWRAGRRWATHFSRVLAAEALLSLLAVALGGTWAAFALPVPCCAAQAFPALLAVCCFFAATPSPAAVGVLFLMSLSVFTYSAATDAGIPGC